MPENEQTPPGGPQEGSQEQPKIIADDDWKAQARAEKQKLAEEVDKQPPSGARPPGSAGRPAGARQLPPASFSTLVNSLLTQAFLALGGMEDRQTGRRYVDLELAKHHIDTLTALEEKTKGNLTDEEKKLLDQSLYESRMQYVAIAQRVVSAPPAGAPRK